MRFSAAMPFLSSLKTDGKPLAGASSPLCDPPRASAVVTPVDDTGGEPCVGKVEGCRINAGCADVIMLHANLGSGWRRMRSAIFPRDIACRGSYELRANEPARPYHALIFIRAEANTLHVSLNAAIRRVNP